MTQLKPIQVKCPLCDALLSVPTDQLGDNVRCPECGSPIKLPGQQRSAAEADDDDWLRLESDLSPPPQRRAVPTDLDDLDEFRIPDLDEPPSSPPAPRPPAGPPPLSESDLEALGGFVEEPAERPAPMKLVVPKEPVDDSFRVRCPVCESITYARPAQVGKRIRCHDCHSPITVPPPPKIRPKYQPDIEAAKTYAFRDAEEGDHPRPADPFRKSAADLLRAAEAETEVEDDEWDLPDMRQWLTAPISIFRDPAVAIHAVLLTLLAFVPAAIAVQFEGNIITLGLFIGGALFGIMVVSCGFAIMQSVANGEDRVSEWPIFDPMETLGEMVVVLAAIAFAAGPAWTLGIYLFQGGLVTVAMSMISLYLLFPVVLLSMLDEQSILSPFSADVTKSVMRAADQWGAAYLCSGILFFVIFMLLMISSVSPPTLGVLLAIATSVCGVFAYFGIVGRLAYGIGHAINAPPMENDIERERTRKPLE